MDVKVFITIDVEEDLWGEYKATQIPVDNVARLPILQDLFDRFGAMPTYFINWPVVTNKFASKILHEILNRGRCEIGTHCHPWNTLPIEEKINNHNSMICNLPYELIEKKLETLHEAIIDRFKVKPICFRSGRWGFGPKVAKAIHKLGYLVDTSVTPFFDWSEDGGADFSDVPTFSYWFNPDDVLREKADGPLLEVPPTIGFLQKNFKLCRLVRRKILNGPLSRYHILGILDKLKILNLRWLSPELSSGPEMILLSKKFIQTGHRFLNMAFHSTSLIPGKTPFVRNQQQLEKFLCDIEMFLQFVVDQGMTFSPLSGALEEVKKQGTNLYENTSQEMNQV